MKRPYKNCADLEQQEKTTGKEIKFFIGTEVEKTPAYNMKTLFVIGFPLVDEILYYYNNNQCEHIYLGANQSFNLSYDKNNIVEGHGSVSWDNMITTLLKADILTTLDFDVKHIEWVLEGGYCEYNNFIPQISVKIPYIRQLNYNAMVKIDDIDFKKSNPGVWCHRLHDLQSLEIFTDWTKYTKDVIL